MLGGGLMSLMVPEGDQHQSMHLFESKTLCYLCNPIGFFGLRAEQRPIVQQAVFLWPTSSEARPVHVTLARVC